MIVLHLIVIGIFRPRGLEVPFLYVAETYKDNAETELIVF
jgi:hypothetical protein